MNGGERRERLGRAQLLLIFTPELCAADPLESLEAALPHVDVVQVRPKARGAGAGPSEARATHDWAERVLDVCSSALVPAPPLVMVNDRVDVARALAERGVDGVHVGDRDTPPVVARELLGPDALIGLSTHDAAQVGAAWDEPVDTLGFGPVFATATKGYGLADTPRDAPRVVGPERAWVVAESSEVPVFPIGGIDLTNVDQLERVGRAAVGSAVLGAGDPARAAEALRALLTGDSAT